MTLALWLLAALALAWAGGWATRRALVAVSPTGHTRTVREMPLTAAFGILVIALYLLVALLAPLSDFAQVSRPLMITAWILGHGLTLLFAPTSVVLVGGLAIARVGYDKYLRFAWPLLLILFVTSSLVIGIAASLE